MKKISWLLIFLIVFASSAMQADNEIPFEYDYKINTLKVIHEDADAVVVYDIDTNLKVAETAVDSLTASKIICIDVQLNVKNEKGMIFASIKRILPAVQYSSYFNLKGEQRIQYMSQLVGDQVSGQLLLENIRFVDLDVQSKSAESSVARRPAVESCYSLGYRYGRCGSRVLLGLTCDQRDNIVIPKRCRDHPQTARGIRTATNEVYQSQGLPTK